MKKGTYFKLGLDKEKLIEGIVGKPNLYIPAQHIEVEHLKEIIKEIDRLNGVDTND